MCKIGIAVFALCAAGCWGQPQELSRIYHFSNIATPLGRQTMADIIRSVTDVKKITLEEGAQDVLVSGTDDQMALLDWLFPQLDQPANSRSGDTPEYVMTFPPGAVRLFHLTHATSPMEALEASNIVRTTLDVTKIFPIADTRAVLVRGSADQVAMSAWMISQLDAGKPTPTAGTQSRQLPGGPDPEVRVFHLAHTTEPQAIQDLANAIRIVGDVNRVFPSVKSALLVIRGPEEMVRLSEWLVSQLDQTPGRQGPAPHEQPMPADEVARVFYPAHGDNAQLVQGMLAAIRSKTNAQRVFSSGQAVVVRGSSPQVRQAAELIAQMDK